MKSIRMAVFPLLSLLAAACADDKASSLTESAAAYDVSLSFNIEVATATDTRGSRELSSTDCRQEADDVRIYVFRSKNGVGDASFTLFDPGADSDGKWPTKDGRQAAVPYIYVDGFERMAGEASIDLNPDGTVKWDNDETHSLSLKVKLPEGYYRFLAIGRDDDTDEKELRTLDWTVEETSWAAAVMNNSGDASATEIFSGFAAGNDPALPQTIHVTSDSRGFIADIVLHRAVAGGFLYVRNIPEVKSDFDWKEAGITKGGTYMPDEVAMVGMGHDRTLSLPGRIAGGRFFSDSDSPLNLSKLVSVTPEEDEERFLENKNYQGGSFLFPTLLSQHPIPGSSFGAEAADGASLALCFYYRGYPLKLKPVKVARTENLHPDTPADRYEEVADSYRFDLRANNLYCLGNRNLEDGTDNPIDLREATGDDLEIIVIGAWQAIVDIEIE